MLNFKQFMEIFDIYGSKDNVDIQSWSRGHTYEFEVPIVNDQGVSEMKKFYLNAFKAPNVSIGPFKALAIPNSFKIFFSGDTGVKLSGIAGMASSLVYRHVLLGIKKIFETQLQQGEPVNALLFSAADRYMLPVYDLFARKFLLPDPPTGQGFVQIHPEVYLNKQWIRDNKEKFSAEDMWRILKTKRFVKKEIESIKKEKKGKS